MRRTSTGWIARAAFVLALACPSLVLAEARPTLLADHPASAHGNTALELELGWYTDSSGGVTMHVLSPFLGLRHAVSNEVELELDWPFAFVDVSPDAGGGDSTFVSGNPLLAAYYVGALERGYYRIGGGVAPPLANLDAGDPGDVIHGIAYTRALWIRGMWDFWLYAYDRLSLVVPVQIEGQSDALVAGGDFAFAFMLPTDDQVAPDNEVVVQLGGMLGGRTGKTTLGARLHLVWIPSSDGDNAQLSLIPFVQGDGSGFIYAKVLLNLDEPLGILGDGGQDVWGLFIGGGGRY